MVSRMQEQIQNTEGSTNKKNVSEYHIINVLQVRTRFLFFCLQVLKFRNLIHKINLHDPPFCLNNK